MNDSSAKKSLQIIISIHGAYIVAKRALQQLHTVAKSRCNTQRWLYTSSGEYVRIINQWTTVSKIIASIWKQKGEEPGLPPPCTIFGMWKWFFKFAKKSSECPVCSAKIFAMFSYPAGSPVKGSRGVIQNLRLEKHFWNIQHFSKCPPPPPTTCLAKF